jgi:hypothetical protein
MARALLILDIRTAARISRGYLWTVFYLSLTHVLAACQAAASLSSLHRAEALCFVRPGFQPEDAAK